MLVSSPMAPDAYPSAWTWEGFTVIPACHGQVVFHNSSHNRMVRMTTDKADSSRHMSPQDQPGGWTWGAFPDCARKALLAIRHGGGPALWHTQSLCLPEWG